ncbi:MAG: LEA type 2 family protein [Spirochaetaceae bacterium]|jgi:LEA14-like dessication related protein|nr:LEA type 2 family protein [Spirochaetaceae bacterium]
MYLAAGRAKRPLPVFFVFFAFCLSCASPPPPGEPAPLPRPAARLSFDRVEAESLEQLTLWFSLEAENPRGKDARLASSGLRVVSNGKTALSGVAFTAPEGLVAGGGKLGLPLRLNIDAGELLKDAGGERGVELSFDLVFDYGGGGTEKIPVKAAASFPLILEPEFRIVSVAVKKAELIDTRFAVKILLKNPNFFPVELSAFSFELYSGGRFWAGGSKKNIVLIPPGQSAETELLLTMNFIDMRRDLLDQVIAMEQIDYRFTGEATISTGIEYLPRFRWKFDQSGRSPVVN